MGYILLSPEYIKSKSEENKIENWHLFDAKIIEDEVENSLRCIQIFCNQSEIYDNKYYDFYKLMHGNSGEIEEERAKNSIMIKRDIIAGKIKFELNKKSGCEKIDSNKKCIENENFEAFSIKSELDKKYTDYYFSVNSIYYTNRNRTFFYSYSEEVIRILACTLGRDVCGVCMSKLYGDLDTKK